MLYYENKHPKMVRVLGDSVFDVLGEPLQLSKQELEQLYRPVDADDLLRRMLRNARSADCKEYQDVISNLHGVAPPSTWVLILWLLKASVRLLFDNSATAHRRLLRAAAFLVVAKGHSLNTLIMEDTHELWEYVPENAASEARH